MAQRKASKPNPIDPVSLAVAALKAIRCAADYHRLDTSTERSVLGAAWDKLPQSEQDRITAIVNNNTQPTPEQIANELSACATLIELQGVKATYGDVVVRAAWKQLSQSERDRLTAICQNGTKPQPQSESELVTEQPAVYKVEPQAQTQPTKHAKRSLYAIGSDMHQSALELEAKLDSIDDPEEQATLIDLWLQESAGLKSEMNDRVNAYLHVIKRQKALAEYRASEGKRLRELAEQSENLAKRLEGQLLQFMDAHNIGRLETKDFKVSPRHASQEPLIVNEDYPLDQVPEEFVVVSRAMNRKLVKDHIRAGNQLPFATLGNKSRYLYIR